MTDTVMRESRRDDPNATADIIIKRERSAQTIKTMTKLIKLLLLSGIALAASLEGVLQVSAQTVDLDATTCFVLACEKKEQP